MIQAFCSLAEYAFYAIGMELADIIIILLLNFAPL